ncbi:unnamed protein product, partial [Iphiclides podalirius]
MPRAAPVDLSTRTGANNPTELCQHRYRPTLTSIPTDANTLPTDANMVTDRRRRSNRWSRSRRSRSHDRLALHLEHGPRVPGDRVVRGLEEVAARVHLGVGGGDAVGGGAGAARGPRPLGGAARGRLASYVQLLQTLGEAVRVDAAAVRAAHGVGPPVRLATQPVQNVFQGAVVHLVLVQELLLADRLRLALQLVDDRLLRWRGARSD